MEYFLAILAAAFSFALNRLLVQKWEAVTIVALAPVVEETAKTLSAYYAGADILLAHFLFGLIEGAFDFWGGRREFRTRAAFFSLSGHSAFGALTVLVFQFSSSIVLALFTAIIAHIAWNAAANRLGKV
ncbi:MAG: hypothetical protein LBR56_08330 [Sporomusaceae bacterium]|jgi:hypothetical protein|nr:hypothetical protein [Sporomusaceae bacterium]